MEYFQRNIDKELLKWKNSKRRKPILIRGARQVGKTKAIQNLGLKFEYFLEINFEENKDIHSIFAGRLSPTEICENLSAIYNMPIIAGKTLLFFDEIQSCIPAIESLRFFYEKIPDLHLIAAGSLLEFALSYIPSFGVGRIRSMFLYPLSFDEFLMALDETKLLKLKNKADYKNPLNEAVHKKLLNYLKKFLLLGGMPEVIASYVETKDFIASRQILDDLLLTYNDDFSKYKKKVPSKRLRDIFVSTANQMGRKFVYSKTNTEANHKQIKESMDLLIQAGLIIPVIHSSANELPLGAEINYKKQKMLLLDTGLLLRLLDLDIGEIILHDEFNVINKGSIAEMFTGLEILKYQSPLKKTQLFYWHREAKNSNAEVDYLIAKNNSIIPVEVKSGSTGKMQSLFLFIKEKKLNFGIRISTENFSYYKNIFVYPLYAVKNILNNQISF